MSSPSSGTFSSSRAGRGSPATASGTYSEELFVDQKVHPTDFSIRTVQELMDDGWRFGFMCTEQVPECDKERDLKEHWRKTLNIRDSDNNKQVKEKEREHSRKYQ